MPETEQTLKIVGGFLLVVVFTLAYVLGQNAQTRTQRNMQGRLELTRQRSQNCETERRMLSGQMKGKEHDELRIAEQDHQALVSENQLLNEDNQQLRQDNYALEEQIDELRDELDDKDFVSDDEVEQLEDAMSFGNNSAELKEFLEDAQILGGINKDTLITKLVNELKRKRTGLTQCKLKRHVEKQIEGEDRTVDSEVDRALAAEREWRKKQKGNDEQVKEWDDYSDDEKAAELQKIVPEIMNLDGKEAQKKMEDWARTFPDGLDDLKEAIDDAKAEIRNVEEEEAIKKNNGGEDDTA
eukprot:TRINITY_DN10161_c0_g1_i1.p1 TRINITY_DN10161_c0_g1~~TRINITY_DN10161_c0_g1_i1.p1  ORF type:complete len:298 (-),score=70.09 TRINITY_DN10161_c0_g1_i1:102-995(-)